MANDDRTDNKVFGDIDPAPGTQDHLPGGPGTGGEEEDIESMHKGSGRVSGGTGTETGGTRNFRQGTGATGGDVGNRPE